MSNHTREGDWYCKQCGYLSASRVTNAETCDMCHNPVVWHDVGVTQERIDLCVNALTARVAALEAKDQPKPSPGPRLIEGMNQLRDAVRNGTLDQLPTTVVARCGDRTVRYTREPKGAGTNPPLPSPSAEVTHQPEADEPRVTGPHDNGKLDIRTKTHFWHPSTQTWCKNFEPTTRVGLFDSVDMIREQIPAARRAWSEMQKPAHPEPVVGMAYMERCCWWRLTADGDIEFNYGTDKEPDWKSSHVLDPDEFRSEVAKGTLVPVPGYKVEGA